MYKKVFCLALLVFGVMVHAHVQAQELPKVGVTVSQTSLANGAVNYRYNVSNNSSLAIVSMSIGSDYYHGVSELSSAPRGWALGTPEGAAIFSPANWAPTVITTEDSPFLEIEWSNNGASEIKPGKSLGGFSVTVPAANATYENSHWTVIFSDSTVASSNLILDGKPRVEAKIISSSKFTTGQWQVELELVNTGAGVASDVKFNDVLIRSLAGAGNATLMTPALPILLGDLAPGARMVVPLLLSLPDTVKKISITESGTMSFDASRLSFSPSQVLYPKN